jgi:glycerol-3-phosphate dehydrogenase
VTGAAFWTDAQMLNSERMCLAFVKSAVHVGAVAANYVSASGFMIQDHHIKGVQARDELTGKEFEIQSRMVINACGGWVDNILRKGKIQISRPIVQLSTAMNLVIKRELLPETAAGILSRFKHTRNDGSVFKGSRILFLSPWRNFTLAGTFHRAYEGDPDELTITEHEIHTTLAEINGAYPGAAVKRNEVTFVHKGFLPMDGINHKNGEVQLTKHYAIRDHGPDDGIEGLISVAGVKYTTARDVAVKTVSRVLKKLGKRSVSKTRYIPLAGGDIHSFSSYLSNLMKRDPYGLGDGVERHLICQYGTEHISVLRLMEEDVGMRELLPDSHEITEAEVVHAIREEMVQKLSDLILRRTDLGSGEYPGDAAVARCAEIMAGELNWAPDRIRQEIEEVQLVYSLFRQVIA